MKGASPVSVIGPEHDCFSDVGKIDVMQSWPDRRLLDLLNLEIPIVQAPMAGSDSVALARSVSSSGALGSLAAALLNPIGVRKAVRALRDGVKGPFNLNFFCHALTVPGSAAKEAWKALLQPHYERLGLDIEAVAESPLRLPFDEQMCEVVEEVRPEVVSFEVHVRCPKRLRGGDCLHTSKR